MIMIVPPPCPTAVQILPDSHLPQHSLAGTVKTQPKSATRCPTCNYCILTGSRKLHDEFVPELDVSVAAGGDGEVGVAGDGGEGDDVAVHEALLVVVRVRQVSQVQLLKLQDLKEGSVSTCVL